MGKFVLDTLARTHGTYVGDRCSMHKYYTQHIIKLLYMQTVLLGCSQNVCISNNLSQATTFHFTSSTNYLQLFILYDQHSTNTHPCPLENLENQPNAKQMLLVQEQVHNSQSTRPSFCIRGADHTRLNSINNLSLSKILLACISWVSCILKDV